ncbi:MAG: NAD-dependent DNA ligase LigA [Bacteroides sp.]|nr:NAD-dependent DNA ligase LigA [Bacteroides sp.]MCM1458161.1 NAD-dependent DNA ligase LigA [Lachnoclostridium sp.]
MTDIQQRIRALRDELNRHNHNYYVLNAPEISDRDFDMMMKELERLEAEHPEYADPLSPTRRVGSDLTKGFEQHLHVYPMLSLGNTYSVEEVDAWVDRTEKALAGSREATIVGEMKFDGTSISLTYEHGRLVRAVTRGDGERGDVVTDNIKTIRSIPLVLQGEGWPDLFEIRGEVLLPWKEFERLNAERAFNEEPLFANPRNAASGTLKLQNPAEVARRGLDAYFYYLLGENLPCATHFDNMMEARRWGFKVSDAMRRLHSMAEVDEYIGYWDTARKELPVATDGLVFKVDSLKEQLNLGFTAKSPRWAIAYKFQAERALTPLRFVSFDVGRMGIITPVANLEPVLLSGTIVKRASLHNEDIMTGLDIHQGDWLYVEKGGEIIPKITGVDTSRREPGAEPVRFVDRCPACGTPLVRQEGEAAWACPNKYGCPPQITGRIEHFAGRRMMNIDGLGEEIVEALWKAGLIRNIADLYTLTAADLERLDRFGAKSAQNLIDGIKASKQVPFTRVLFALSIPNVGETTAKKIARTVGSVDRLMAMSAEELTAIEDVGPMIANNIIEYFATESNRAIVERLRSYGVQLEMEEDTSARTDTLAGKTFVISGVFTLHSRDQYKQMIEQNGGKNSGSISKKTDYVLAGENMGPAKLEKARSLGIPIINEQEFLAMLGDAGTQSSGL